MANGISDLLAPNGGGLREALASQREARRARLTAKVQSAGAGLSGLERGLAQFGAGLGGGIAGEVFKEPDSAEVEAARENAALAREIQTLGTGDNALAPGTSEYMAAAGQKAQAAGRTDLALQFAEQSAALKVRESALVAKSEKEAAEAERSAFSGLPSAVKLSVTANDPARVQRVLGLTEKQAKVISKDAADTLKTLQAENQKALDELNAVRTTKSTSEDVQQTIGLLANKAIDGSSFEGFMGRDDPERAENFARLMDQQATAEIDAAAKEGSGVRRTKDDIYNEIMTELSESGGVEGWGTDDVTGIDLEKLGTIFKARKAAVPAPKQSSTAPTRRRVVAQP